MAVNCDPNDLLANAACFLKCLNADQRQAVMTYLLAIIAGGSTDPQVLLTAARCFHSCLTVAQMKAIQTYLLCQIAP